MAGHSKWANIKHRKAAQDKKRGRAFSHIIKKILSAARRGGGDPSMNAELRVMIDKARAINVHKDTIDRAIKKATGQLDGISYEDFSYEGYGAGGVAVMVEGATDNRNRIVASVRHAFSRTDGNLGENGCVGWMFETRGIIAVDAAVAPGADALMEVALENGAIEFEVEDGGYTIECEAADFPALRQALLDHGVSEFLNDEVTRVAQNCVTPSVDEARQVMKLLDLLEEEDDIENVYHNLELSDELEAALNP